MTNIKWRFPILDGGRTQGFNNSGITFFKENFINNLAREVCQNSLDAKQADKNKVKIEFSIKKIESSICAISDLKDIVGRCKIYWKNHNDSKLNTFFIDAESVLANDFVDFLVISDYNTKGLEGSKEGREENSVWNALTTSDGVTIKGDTGGGSFGIGKNAPFACSKVRTVFYNTFAIDGEHAFLGVSSLVTHKNEAEENTQGTGFYEEVIEKRPIFRDDECLLRDQFVRTNYGTDVIIPAFNKTERWKEDIEFAIINNFFYSIFSGKLEVIIEDVVLNKDNLAARIEHYINSIDPETSEGDSIRITSDFYNALINENSIKLNKTIYDESDLNLIILKGEKLSKRIAKIRSIGMIISIKLKNMLTGFTALLIANGPKINELLRKTEPPKHDSWDPKLIDTNFAEQKEASKVIREINKFINDSIIANCKIEVRESIDPDGVSDFLPFDEERFDSPSSNRSDNSLETQTHLMKPLKIDVSKNRVTVKATKINGAGDTESDTHNESSGAKDGSISHGGENNGDGSRVEPNKSGSKNQSIAREINLLFDRVYVISSDLGIYKAIIKAKDDHQRVVLFLEAIGEDNRKEKLLIEQYTLNGNPVRFREPQSHLELNNIVNNTIYELYITITVKEKLLINLEVRSI